MPSEKRKGDALEMLTFGNLRKQGTIRDRRQELDGSKLKVKGPMKDRGERKKGIPSV